MYSKSLYSLSYVQHVRYVFTKLRNDVKSPKTPPFGCVAWLFRCFSLQSLSNNVLERLPSLRRSSENALAAAAVGSYR